MLLVPFVPLQKERFFFSLGKGTVSFLLSEAGEDGWYFSSAQENDTLLQGYTQSALSDRPAIRGAKPDPRLCDRVHLV